MFNLIGRVLAQTPNLPLTAPGAQMQAPARAITTQGANGMPVVTPAAGNAVTGGGTTTTAGSQIPGITLVPDTINFQQYFTRIINVALYIGGAIAVIYLIWGGISYVTAGGDQAKADSARLIIVNALIGIVIIALALVLVTWVSHATNTGITTPNI